jgi:hypothetical protein
MTTQAEWLLSSLIETARRSEQQTHEDIIRLKAKLEQLRQHRMELEAVSDAQAIEAQRAATVKQGAVADESAVAESDAPKEGQSSSSHSIEVEE